MSKRIVIVGGGISGLSVLHQLKKIYPQESDAQIVLFEKNSYLGGTAHTQYYPEYTFEEGANGFLDSRESMRELIAELGMTRELIQCDPRSAARFICVDNELIELPKDPFALLRFPKLSIRDKLRIGKEMFIPRGNVNNETVFAFAQRRLGPNFAKYFIDPMVTGIFGGQADQLILRYAFPKIHELEQIHGSLFKAKFFSKRKDKFTADSKGVLTSLRRGMSQLTEVLADTYKEHIRTKIEVTTIRSQDDVWQVQSAAGSYEADQVFVCTPSYIAAELVREKDAILAQALAAIDYAPIAVVGCLYRLEDLTDIPEGFGYLVPSSEKKDVLGALFDTNLFPSRTAENYFLIRLMLGGVRRPNVVLKSEKELTEIVKEELLETLGVVADPHAVTVKVWRKAIPQYNAEYVKSLATINTCLSQLSHLYLVSNYLGGVSLNDCAVSALQAVKKSIGRFD